MSLQELKIGRSPHLRRNHAEEVVLDPYNIDSLDLSVYHLELEGAGEGLGHLSLPMEIYAYDDVMEDECRHGEEG